jgi:hypothetical protein
MAQYRLVCVEELNQKVSSWDIKAIIPLNAGQTLPMSYSRDMRKIPRCLPTASSLLFRTPDPGCGPPGSTGRLCTAANVTNARHSLDHRSCGAVHRETAQIRLRISGRAVIQGTRSAPPRSKLEDAGQLGARSCGDDAASASQAPCPDEVRDRAASTDQLPGSSIFLVGLQDSNDRRSRISIFPCVWGLCEWYLASEWKHMRQSPLFVSEHKGNIFAPQAGHQVANQSFPICILYLRQSPS